MTTSFWVTMLVFGGIVVHDSVSLTREWRRDHTVTPLSVGSFMAAFLAYLWLLAFYVKQ